jgi:hypothetical protein
MYQPINFSYPRNFPANTEVKLTIVFLYVVMQVIVVMVMMVIAWDRIHIIYKTNTYVGWATNE